MPGSDFEARYSQYLANLNSGMNSEQAASAVKTGQGNVSSGSGVNSGTNTGIGTLYADRSEADHAAQQRQKIWSIINGTADRSEYDTIMAQAQGIGNQLKKYDYQGDREEADAVAVAKQRNAEMAKRTQPSFSQYADRSEYDAMQSEKQSLEKKLDEVNTSLSYAATVDENDALQDQRKDILDRLHEIDRLSGETLKSYDSQERAGNVVTGATDSTASSYVNLMGTGAGVGNTLNEASRVEDRKVASSDYAGWATDELTAGNMAGSISYGKMKENEQRRRDEEQRLYDIADSLSYRSAEKTVAAKEGLGTVGKFGVDLTQQFIQQGIDAGGRLLGLGMLPFFSRAAGGAMGEARQAGASSGQQLLYGFTVGGIETAIEKVSGSNKLFGKGVLDKAILGLADKAKSPAVRSAVQILLGGISEGGEEVLSDILNPFAQLIYNNDSVAETWENRDEYKVQMLQDFLIGAAMGLVGEGASSGVDAIAQNTQQNTINPTEQTSLQNDAAPQNTQHSASNIPGNIQTPPAVQNAPTASPALFNTQANSVVNTTQQSPAYNNENAAQNQTQYSNSGQNVNGNLRERGFSENIRTDAAMEEEVRAAFETDPSLYQQQSNADTLAKAQEIYNKGTYEAARQLNDAISKAKAGSKLPVEMIPLSRLVANDLAKQGKVQEARDMLADIATELTYYGQASQAARILRDSDPMTQATAIERLVSRLNDDLTKGQKTKNIKRGLSETGEIVLNQDLLNEYVKETDPAVKNQILSEMQQDIADQIPATFSEKFTAMRYLNMLGNLKTQGRNIIGNTAMLGVTKSKNLVKASIEGLASAVTGGKYERTTSFYVNSELRKEANADADLMMDVLSGQGKYSDANRVSNKDIQDKRRIFDSKFLEGYRNLTNWAMETGDRVFLKATYSDALGGWLQAHGINSISEATPEQLSKARAFAMKEAQEATFRDSNAISDWVSSIGRSKNSPSAVKFISEGIAPFRKTPANVAVRAVEYSPLGIAETIVKGIQTKSGKANATDVINSLSKNIIGSALFAAGMLAYSAGFARGTEDDEELDQFQKMQGAQDYSIKLRINGEDTYVSLSQFAPAAVPFFIGVEFSNALQSEGNFVDKLPKIIGAVSGPMLEMSMLGGINDALSNLSTYGNTSSGLPMLFVNSAISYLTQGLTSTFLGQLEQANEEYRQTTYTDKNSIIPTWLQYPLGKAAAKTPGIDYNQQDYIDAWGRRQSNGNALQRFLNATVNPTYYSAERGTSVDAELERLYSENKNVEGFPNVLPDKAARSTEYTKGKTLTPEEYQQYSIDRGQMSLELIQDFMSGNDYQSLTDQQRAEVISNLYSLAADRAMKKVKTSNGVEYTGDLDDEASLSDIPAYYSYSAIMRDAADKKPTTDWQSVMKMMQSFTSLPDDVKTELKGKSDMHLKAVEYATNNGLSPEDWYSTYDVIKDAKVSTGSEAQLVSAIAINGTNKNLSDSDKLMMLQSQLPLAKDGKIPTIVRRYDVAMNSFGISFDDWTKFETELKDADSTSKWAIRSAAQSVGVNPDNAVKIYKTLYDDPKYTAQVNEEFLYLNPVDESGEVEPMSFSEYYNSFNEEQAPKHGTNSVFTPGMTPGMTENDYQKLMRMARG